MEERKQFTFYRSFEVAARSLKKSDRLDFLEALIQYGLQGKEPEKLSVVANGMFELCRPTLDAARRKAMGGMAPRTTRKHPENTWQREKKDTPKEKENEKEIENENEKETEIEYSQAESAFAAFWSAYPCQLEKDSAFSAWMSLNPDEKTVQAIMHALKGWKKCAQWTAEDGRYVPRAAKWLLQGHWKQIPKAGKAAAVGVSGELGEAELEAIRMALAQ